MTPLADALDRCLTLMTRAAPHPKDAEVWHTTLRQASIILARNAGPTPASGKSFWRIAAIIAATVAVTLALAQLAQPAASQPAPQADPTRTATRFA